MKNKLRKANILPYKFQKEQQRKWWQHRNLKITVENFPEQKPVHNLSKNNKFRITTKNKFASYHIKIKLENTKLKKKNFKVT